MLVAVLVLSSIAFAGVRPHEAIENPQEFESCVRVAKSNHVNAIAKAKRNYNKGIDEAIEQADPRGRDQLIKEATAGLVINSRFADTDYYVALMECWVEFGMS